MEKAKSIPSAGIALLLAATLGGVPRLARASDSPVFYAGLGVTLENMNDYSSTPQSNSPGFFGTVYYNVTIEGRFGIASDWLYLAPDATFTPLGVGSPEGGETTRILTFAPRLAMALGPVDFLLGPGLLHRMVSASGGTTTLNNGTSTAVFALPPSSTSSNLFFLDVGLGTNIASFRLNTEALIMDLTSSRRAVDGLITVSYGLF